MSYGSFSCFITVLFGVVHLNLDDLLWSLMLFLVLSFLSNFLSAHVSDYRTVKFQGFFLFAFLEFSFGNVFCFFFFSSQFHEASFSKCGTDKRYQQRLLNAPFRIGDWIIINGKPKRTERMWEKTTLICTEWSVIWFPLFSITTKLFFLIVFSSWTVGKIVIFVSDAIIMISHRYFFTSFILRYFILQELILLIACD